MAETKVGGNPVHTSGDLPAKGQAAPDLRYFDTPRK